MTSPTSKSSSSSQNNAPKVTADDIIELIINGYMRNNLLSARNMKYVVIPIRITLITSRYFYKTESSSSSLSSSSNTVRQTTDDISMEQRRQQNNVNKPLYLSNPNVPAPPSRNHHHLHMVR